VLVNGDFDGPLSLFLCNAGPALAARQKAALDEDQSLLQRQWNLGELGALYKVRKENLDALSGIVTPGQRIRVRRSTEELTRGILLRSLPADVMPVLPDTVAGITLTAVALDSSRVARGESLGFTLYWRRVGQPARFPTITQLLFETESPRGRLWTHRLSKLHRLWMQARQGLLYRLRVPVVPLAGVFGNQHWPQDRYVVDRFEVMVPERMAPGEYVFRAMWQEQTFLPNLPLQHYLSDQDAYQGAAIGLVEVY
jgi:hypothetical protein